MSINIIFLVGQAKIFNADREKCLTPHPVVCSASCKIISWNVFPNLLSLLRDKELKIEQVTCFTVSVTEDILKLGTLMSNKCHKAFTWTFFTIRNRNIDIWNESKTLWNLFRTFIISLHKPIFFQSDFVILVCVIYQARNVAVQYNL